MLIPYLSVNFYFYCLFTFYVPLPFLCRPISLKSSYFTTTVISPEVILYGKTGI